MKTLGHCSNLIQIGALVLLVAFGCKKEESDDDSDDGAGEAPTVVSSGESPDSGDTSGGSGGIPPVGGTTGGGSGSDDGSGGDDGAEPEPTITAPTISTAGFVGSPFSLAGACTTGNLVTITGDFSAGDLGGSSSVTCTGSAFSFTATKEDGSYSVNVTASQTGGTSQSTSTTIVVDTVSPGAIGMVSPPTSAYQSADSPLSISGSCESGATVSLSGDGSGSALCVTEEFSIDFTPVAEQLYTIGIFQTDATGNDSGVVTLNWTYNSSVPTTPIITTSGPVYSSTGSAVLTGECGETAVVVEVGGSGLTAATDTCTAGTPNTFSSLTVSAASEGAYMAEVSQTNGSGTSGKALIEFIYDATISRPIITSPVETGPTPDVAVTQAGPLVIAGTCESGSTVFIDPAVEATASDSDSTTCTPEGTFSLSLEEAGTSTYHYDLKQVDLTGNDSGALDRFTEVEWTRDPSTPGKPVISSPEQVFYTSDTSVTITGTCVGSNTVRLYDENPAVAPEAASEACSSGTFSITFDCGGACAESAHSWILTEFNGTNESLEEPFNWQVDQTNPDATISGQPSDPNETPSGTFTFSAIDDTPVSFQCKLDSESFSACSSPYSITSIADGSRTFTLRTTDSVGQFEEETYSWTQVSQNTAALFHFDSTSTPAYLDDDSHTGAINDLAGTGTGTAACGNFDDCFDFDRASSETLSTDNGTTSANLPTQSGLKNVMTIESFFKIDNHGGLSNGDYLTVASRGTTAGSDFQWGLRLQRRNPTGSQRYKAVFSYSLDGSTATNIISGNLDGLGDNTWHHIAVTVDQGSVTIWVDGASVATGSTGSAAMFDSSGDIHIGSMNSADYYDGQLDEVRVSNVIRYVTAFTPTASAFSAD